MEGGVPCEGEGRTLHTVNRMTENTTFPHLRWRAVMILFSVSVLISVLLYHVILILRQRM